MVKVQFSFGPLEMVVITTITVTVMVISPVFTPYLLVRSMIRGNHRGMPSHAHQHLRSPTVAVEKEKM